MKTMIKSALVSLSLILASQIAVASQLDTSFRPFVVDPSNPEVFGLFGPIDSRTAFNFKRAVSKYGTPSEILLDSPGGHVHEGLLLALEVQEIGLKTRVTGDCMSACFFVFIAGQQRQIDGRLGVHQMSNSSNDFSSGQLAIADMMDVLGGLNVPNEVLVLMFQTPSEEMHVFTQNEISRFGLENSSRNYARSQTKPYANQSNLLDQAISFVGQHNKIWSQENNLALSRIARTYANSVDFYNTQWSHEKVMAEKRAFAQRWPVRDYEFKPSIRSSYCSNNGKCTIVGEVDWYAHSPVRGKTSIGTSSVVIGVKKTEGSFVIFKEDGKVISRK